MATSSSDESYKAPKDFHLSSSIEDSGSRLSLNNHKCILCNNSRKTFYCKQCVRNGDFVHSTSHFSERFAEKQLRLLKLKSGRRLTEKRCCELLKQRQHANNLETDIKVTQERLKLLRLLVRQKTDSLNAETEKLTALQEINNTLSIKLPKYEDRVKKLEEYVASKAEDVEKRRQVIAEHSQELKKVVRGSIQRLMEYIFPISQVQPSRVEEDTSLDTVCALAEATHTSYIRGRWVFTDSSGELQHCIVAPSLPGSGNYTAYNDWVTANKDGVPASSSMDAAEQNPAYKISAALTYTAQLVNVLAFYLDVRLPYKMMYSDFCSNDMTEQQFARRVARLNSNTLQLCFSQNVPVELLHPLHTLQNVLHLLNTNVSDLGRQGPIEVLVWLDTSLEAQLVSDLTGGEESDSEDGDHLPWEWEAVPHVQCPEAVPMVGAGPNMSGTQQATSMAGGLVTSAAASIASIWKGWTGGK